MVAVYMLLLVFIAIFLHYIGLGILSPVVILTGLYVAVFSVFKDMGTFVLIYKGMVGLGITIIVLMILGQLIAGWKSTSRPEIKVFSDLKLGLFVFGPVIAVYSSFIFFVGGAADCEFGPFSIMNLVGDAGILEGLWILLRFGLILGVVIMILSCAAEILGYYAKTALKKK